MKRTNISISAKVEQAILNVLARLVPKFIGPDFLTGLALLAAIGIAISYFYAIEYRGFYLIAALLYFVHWYGDSLDGKIARDRKVPRPRYGHYIDHILDSVSVAIILGGLTASAVTFTSAWLWVVTGFLLLMTHAFLKASVTNNFELSFGLIGPTEARMLGAGFSTLLFFTGNPQMVEVTLLKIVYPFTLLDLVGGVVATIIWGVMIHQIFLTAKMLDKEDRAKWKIKKGHD